MLAGTSQSVSAHTTTMASTALQAARAGCSREADAQLATLEVGPDSEAELVPQGKTLSDVVLDARIGPEMLEAEHKHGGKVARIVKKVADFQDKVWVPMQVQHIVACSAFLDQNGLLEYTPKLPIGAPKSRLAVAVHSTSPYVGNTPILVLPVVFCVRSISLTAS